jgi:hypothetical protein
MARYYFMSIAVVAMVSGLLFLSSRIQLLLNGARIVGEVKKKQKRTWTDTDGGGYAYLLVITYIGIDGETKNFTEQNAIPTFFYNVGDKIKLLQDQNKPNRVMVHSNIVLFSAPLVMLLLAAIAGYVGFQ